MTRELDGIASATPRMKVMPERALGNLKEGVGVGEDGRVVIGPKMDLQKLKPYLGLGHRGLVLDTDLLAEFARYEALPATYIVTQATLPEGGGDGPEITKEQCKVCNSLEIDGVLRKAAGENKKLVVMSQGLLAGRDSLANQWIRHYLGKSGVDVLCFDYFEGKNKVDVSFQKRVGDLMEIIQRYANAGYEVGGYGSSVGGSALWNAASLLGKQGTQIKTIANRTIIPDLSESFARTLNTTREYIIDNAEEVSNSIKSFQMIDGMGQINATPDELKEMCTGKFNLDKYVDIRCPTLNVQGSGDTVAGMNLVRDLMSNLKHFNTDSHLVEVAGAAHRGDNQRDFIMQMYLLVSFLKKHMLDVKS